MRDISALTAVLLALLAAPAEPGQSRPCAGFGSSLQPELAALAAPQIDVTAGRSAATAAPVTLGRSARVRLLRQADVVFTRPPERSRGGPESFAGLLAIDQLPKGRWRVSVDDAAWIDVVAADRALASPSFQMDANCGPMRKSVVFEQPAPARALVQISGGTVAEIRLVVTPVTAP
jgi:hypothetical protein